jgi:hypothetical protein
LGRFIRIDQQYATSPDHFASWPLNAGGPSEGAPTPDVFDSIVAGDREWALVGSLPAVQPVCLGKRLAGEFPVARRLTGRA